MTTLEAALTRALGGHDQVVGVVAEAGPARRVGIAWMVTTMLLSCVAPIRLVEYLDGQGRSPYAKWFDSLNAPAAAKVAAAVYQLAAGNFSNVKGVGSVRKEDRVRSGLPGLFRQRCRGAGDPAGREQQTTAAGSHRRGKGTMDRLPAPEGVNHKRGYYGTHTGLQGNHSGSGAA